MIYTAFVTRVYMHVLSLWLIMWKVWRLHVSTVWENGQHCVVICYFGLKGLSAKEVHKDTVVTQGESGPSWTMVKTQAAESNRESLKNDLYPVGTIPVTTQETVDKIHDILISWQMDE